MIDPFTAFAAAQTAVSAIKKGIQLGKDIGGISNDLAKFAGAVSDLTFAHKQSENPPWYAYYSVVVALVRWTSSLRRNKRRLYVLRLNSIFSLLTGKVLGTNFSTLKRKYVKTVRKLCIARLRLSRLLLSGALVYWLFYQELVFLAWGFISSAKNKESGNG